MDGQRLDEPIIAAPEHSMLSDRVYQVLREALITHAIVPGSRLNIANLSRQLHVSNTPLRQALVRLQAEGLVTQEAYRGYAASLMLDGRTIAELYDTRLIVEPAAVVLATHRATPADLEGLQALCAPDEIDALLENRSAYNDELGRRDIDLHISISTLSGNSVLSGVVTHLISRGDRYTRYHQRAAAEAAWNEHAQVVEAMRHGDAEGAAAAMRTHLSNGLARIQQALR